MWLVDLGAAVDVAVDVVVDVGVAVDLGRDRRGGGGV